MEQSPQQRRPPGYPRLSRSVGGALAAVALLLGAGLGAALLLPPGAQAGEPSAYLLVAGGSRPSQTQASLEAHVDLLRRALVSASGAGDPASGMGGELLFGAGPGPFPVVQEERRAPPAPAVRRLLAELFGHLPSWKYGYRASRLGGITGPARKTTLLEAFERTAARVAPGGTQLLYFSGHGTVEAAPWGPTLWLWGDERLALGELSELLDRQPADRMHVLVLTQCYAGAFAPLLHPAADSARLPEAGCRCAFFATLGDRESTGCTTARRPQDYDDYSLRLAEALSGRRASGRPVGPRDLDADGRVGLAEAHAYARIHERSMDVPTCTSEYWLRLHATPHGEPLNLGSPFEQLLQAARPTERAVLSGLHEHLPPGGGVPVLRARYEVEQLGVALEGLGQRGDTIAAERDALINTLITDLSARWPVLEEPWHPDFEPTVARAGAEIADFIEGHGKLQQVRASDGALALLDRQRELLMMRQATLERFVRAAENVALEADLRRRGGAPLHALERLLACEAWVPGDGAAAGCER